MSYNDDFYQAYEEYLNEPEVRKRHNFVFTIVKQNPAFHRVVDLGCGQSREFNTYVCPLEYVGIDSIAQGSNIITGNYRDESTVDFIRGFNPSAFVSLFSAEITAPVEQNYILYEKLFKELHICAGLVSGFFYVSKKHTPIVMEAGDVQSFQTLEDIDTVISSTFSETRRVLPVPSQMFGTDVFEVWKIFEKR